MRLSKNETKILDILNFPFLPEGFTGYEIIKAVKKKYNKNIWLGTLYNNLYSLEKKGLIKALHGDRKKYVITAKGIDIIIASIQIGVLLFADTAIIKDKG